MKPTLTQEREVSLTYHIEPQLLWAPAAEGGKLPCWNTAPWSQENIKLSSQARPSRASPVHLATFPHLLCPPTLVCPSNFHECSDLRTFASAVLSAKDCLPQLCLLGDPSSGVCGLRPPQWCLRQGSAPRPSGLEDKAGFCRGIRAGLGKQRRPGPVGVCACGPCTRSGGSESCPHHPGVSQRRPTISVLTTDGLAHSDK